MNRSRMAVASGIGCCLMAVALFASYLLDMDRHGIAVTSRFHFGLFDGGAWFYSDQQPYHGSINQIASQPAASQKSGLDFPGVYYRYFRFPAHTTWSLMVSLWYPILLLAILPALWILHRRRLRLSHDQRNLTTGVQRHRHASPPEPECSAAWRLRSGVWTFFERGEE